MRRPFSDRRRLPSNCAPFAPTKHCARRSVNPERRRLPLRAPATEEATMAAERKDQHPADAWSDIPDPILGAAPPSSASMKAPATASATRSQVQLQRLVLLGM